MQVNVANSNIVNKENTIVNIGVDNETPIKSSGKIQEDKVTIYKNSNQTDKTVTYSKDVMGEEQNRAKEQATAASLIDSLNTMITPEGYDQMEELGIVVDDENPELSMSVYERIQMELATYCKDYVPTGLNIDEKKLEELLGSAAFANAVDKAMSVRNLDDQTKAAIVKDENIENLQIDKVYEKAYSCMKNGTTNYAGNNTAASAAGGTANSGETLGKKEIDDKVWEELKPQIEKLLSNWGIENTKEIEGISKWLVSNEIPVTKENICKAVMLQDNSRLDEQQYKDMVERNVAYALYFSGNTRGAAIEKGQYELADVNQAIESINNITNGQLDRLIEDNKELNIENINKYAKLPAEEADTPVKESIGVSTSESGNIQQAGAGENNEGNIQIITARKVVVEATLIMTVPALMRVKQLGININVTDLTTLLDKINEMENKEAEKYLESVDAKVTQTNISSFIATNKAMLTIKQTDISFVARVQKTDSLEKVAKIAISSYEEGATRVRKDLGDSYEKAFSNIDDILDNLDMEPNEENKRAVKILGYNAMSITKASVENVKEMAGQIDNLVENLNPKAAAYLIANDINPMKKNILELNSELENINEDIGTTEENYAQFLWNLEKSNSISKEDRQKYISLFRNIKSITKKDIQALGAVINSNMDFTMDSLLMAVKSRKITGEIYKWGDNGETYEEYKLNMQKEGVVTDEQINQLISNHIVVTPRNIKNTDKLQNEKDVFDTFYNSSSEEVKAIVDNILDADDPEELNQAFENIYMEAKKTVKNQIHKELPLYSDIETALENSGLARIVNEYAKNDTYYIPVKTGENITNIHLTLKSGEEESKAFVDIKESWAGELHFEFYENDNTLKGMLVYENKSSVNEVNEMAADFKALLSENNIQVTDITVVNSETYIGTSNIESKKTTRESINRSNSLNERDTDKSKNSEKGKRLFRAVKLFITTVRTYETQQISR